ncbi:MAG: C1 family peptidase [Blastocatellia bacterium]
MNGETINIAQLQESIAAQEAGWQASPNELTALPPDELKLRLGFNPPPGQPSLAEREQAAKASLAAHESGALGAFGAPASFDLRNVGGRNFITAVKNQGGCGSCVSFGTVATVEGTLRWSINDPNYPIDLSEAHLFYCHARALGRTCGNGWWPEPAFDAFKNIGVVDDACYPYTASDQNCTGRCADWANRVFKIGAWHSITNPAQMKEWLSTRGPLETCFTVYTDFFAYRSGVYRQVSGKVEGGHCVSVVGYDDTAGCWICKNSWGTGWGEAGFFRIAYGQVGIDANMIAVDSFVTGVWQNNKRIVGLWSNNADRNAYVYVDGIGWKRITGDNDNIHLNMLAQLIAAKAANRPVNYFEESGVIKQVYVL